MSNRTIKAPGVEIFERDFSDYSVVDAGTSVLVSGFAPKGEDYEPKTVMSMDIWDRLYGKPTNEAEEYFRASAEEVISRGGILRASKIPYTNGMTGQYVAARFSIGSPVDFAAEDEEPGKIDVKAQYSGLKSLGVGSFSIIAPSGAEFLSYDRVSDFEEGESQPGANTIFIVDKTRATYENAVQVSDVQENRDSRSCLGILPVITTLANTAWFQKQSTGLVSDIVELYQPVRSLKTITVSSMSGTVEYQPTSLTDADLSPRLMKTRAYVRSLSEMAAMQAQSCLVDGNMVDGKFAKHVCNDVAVVVFKAFVSPDDSKIDFEVVEQFVGSLNKAEVDENGRSRYIGTMINDNSEYIYFFSNLANADTVLKADHAFVAGSDADPEDVEKEIEDQPEYVASKEFGNAASDMLGFYTYSEYNQNASNVAMSEPVVDGVHSFGDLVADIDDSSESAAIISSWTSGRDISVPDTILTGMPSIENDGEDVLTLNDDYRLQDANNNPYVVPDEIADEDYFKLSIFNSVDYVDAVYKFEPLVDEEACEEALGLEGDALKARMEQLLIVNSMEKNTQYKSLLAKAKSAEDAVKALDSKFAGGTTEDYKYVSSVYYRLDGQNLLDGITFVGGDPVTEATTLGEVAEILGLPLDSTMDDVRSELGLADGSTMDDVRVAVNKKVGKRSSKKRSTRAADSKEAEQYIKSRVYLRGQVYAAYRAVYEYVLSVLKSCASAPSRYLQAKQSVDDACIMLGFYPEMAKPVITFHEITNALDKTFDTLGNVYNTTIDVIVDAGLSNIAQFVKQVYDPNSDDEIDVGGEYEPVKFSSSFKLRKNTDLSYWRTIIAKYDTFCKSIRKDCMFIADAPRHLVLNGNRPTVRSTKRDTSIDNDILPYLTMLNSFNTSYGAGYINWYKTVSSANGSVLWVPPSIKAAGTYILTDSAYNWWDAPAGQRRGVITASDVAFNPNQRQAGEIYDVSWNYAVNYSASTVAGVGGIVQEGQKTLQNRPSAFDRVNVRRLFLRCERFAFFASLAFLYEPHTELTREHYVDTLTPFFNDLLQRGGIQDFKIICDETNNTPDTIDRNELRVKIGLLPTKTIEWVIIDMVCSRTGTSWTELATV